MENIPCLLVVNVMLAETLKYLYISKVTTKIILKFVFYFSMTHKLTSKLMVKFLFAILCLEH